MSCFSKNTLKSLFRPLPKKHSSCLIFFLHLFTCSWQEITILPSDSGNKSVNTLLTVFYKGYFKPLTSLPPVVQDRYLEDSF